MAWRDCTINALAEAMSARESLIHWRLRRGSTRLPVRAGVGGMPSGPLEENMLSQRLRHAVYFSVRSLPQPGERPKSGRHLQVLRSERATKHLLVDRQAAPRGVAPLSHQPANVPAVPLIRANGYRSSSARHPRVDRLWLTPRHGQCRIRWTPAVMPAAAARGG